MRGFGVKCDVNHIYIGIWARHYRSQRNHITVCYIKPKCYLVDYPFNKYMLKLY